MDLDVTVRAVRVLRVQVELRTSGLVRSATVRGDVTRQPQLCDTTRNYQARIRRTVRRVTRDAAIGLHRRMLVYKRSLLVGVTLEASGVRSGRESRLFEFETAVRIVTIAALHRAFQHLVMERQIELVLRLTVATETELWLARLEQFQIRESRFLRVGS